MNTVGLVRRLENAADAVVAKDGAAAADEEPIIDSNSSFIDIGQFPALPPCEMTLGNAFWATIGRYVFAFEVRQLVRVSHPPLVLNRIDSRQQRHQVQDLFAFANLILVVKSKNLYKSATVTLRAVTEPSSSR